MRLCMCIMRPKCWGGVFEPVEPPVEKPEAPTTPPSTEDLLTIKIENDIMAVVGTDTWNAIAYGNGKYVAVGASGYVTTSADGKTWTAPTKAGTEEWLSVAFGNEKFVAVGRKNVAVSSNGISWTVYNNVTSNYLLSVAYGNGQFVMVGSGSYIGVSTDGKTWTNITGVNTGYLWDVIYADGKFRAVGMEGYYSTSTNGTTWTVNKFTNSSSYARHSAYGNNTVVVVGDSGQIWSFTDDDPNTVNYTNGGYSLYGHISDVIYANGMFVAISQVYKFEGRTTYTAVIITSVDGVTWAEPVAIIDENGNAVQGTNLKVTEIMRAQ